jgi:glycosyltransferase involved in cell wall biosynthesis
MPLRNILIVTYYFPPSAASGSFRLLGFVRHLPKFGWQASVVAPPSLPWEPTDEGLLARVPAGTLVHHVPYPAGLLWKPLRRFAMLEMWLPFAWARTCRAFRDQRPEAVLTSGPPHAVHLIGLWLKRRHDFLWVADFRDPWTSGDPTCLAMNNGAWERRAEASVIHEADVIVANTPGALDLLAGAYPQHAAKMVAITNGFDPENFANISPPATVRQAVDIIHTGEIYADRNPQPLLDAVRLLVPTGLTGGRPFQVRFIGRLGTGASQLAELIHAQGLDEVVSFPGQIPYSRSIEEMTRADILLLMDSPGRRAGVPAKLYEYIGAGRPILALAEPGGDVASILRESGALHRVTPPLDPKAIRQALVELFQESVLLSPDPAKRTSASRFTREAVAGELARLLDSSLDGSGVLTARQSDARTLAEYAR